MRRDLVIIRFRRRRGLEQWKALGGISRHHISPAETVANRGIVGGKIDCPLEQSYGAGKPAAMLDPRISERVQDVRIIRTQRERLRIAALRLFSLTGLFIYLSLKVE